MGIKNKQLMDYCRAQTHTPPGVPLFNVLLIFVVLLFAVSARTVTYIELLWKSIILFLSCVFTLFAVKERDNKALIKKCRESLHNREFRRRLERCSQQEILSILQESITRKYHVKDLRCTDKALEGEYNKEKLQVVYVFAGENEVVEKRELFRVLRACHERGIKQVRVITDGVFSKNTAALAEQYDLVLKLFEGKEMKKIVSDSCLCPSDTELDAILKHEAEKRERKFSVLREQALQANKSRNYFFYGLILLAMTRLKIGFESWNLLFGTILVIMAVVSFIKDTRDTKKELSF